MAAHQYQFISRWRVAASPEETAAILADAESLPRWWSSVYLSVRRQGDVCHVHSRGWLPYTLRWSFTRTGETPAQSLALRAWGDLAGTGVWTFHPALHGHTEATFVWTVEANKPLLRYLSWLLKPLFAANHRWAMAQGERAIASEVARRRLLQTVGA